MAAWSLVATGALGQRAFCEFDREARELGDKDVRVKGSKLNLGFPSLIGKPTGRGGRAPSPPRRPRKASPPRTARGKSPPRPTEREPDCSSPKAMVSPPAPKPTGKAKQGSPPRPAAREEAKAEAPSRREPSPPPPPPPDDDALQYQQQVGGLAVPQVAMRVPPGVDEQVGERLVSVGIEAYVLDAMSGLPPAMQHLIASEFFALHPWQGHNRSALITSMINDVLMRPPPGIGGSLPSPQHGVPPPGGGAPPPTYKEAVGGDAHALQGGVPPHVLPPQYHPSMSHGGGGGGGGGMFPMGAPREQVLSMLEQHLIIRGWPLREFDRECVDALLSMPEVGRDAVVREIMSHDGSKVMSSLPHIA